MNQLLAVLVLAGLHSARSQSWVGEDDFNSPAVDPAKWTIYQGSGLLKTPTAVSFFSTVESGYFTDGLFWHANLPTNERWMVTVRASISPDFITDDPSKFCEALLAIAPAGNFDSYFTNALQRGDTYNIVPNWEINGGGNQELLSNIGLDTLLLRMEFDPESQSITSSHADTADPTNFTITQTVSTADWLGLTSFVALIGMHTQDTSLSSGLLTLDDFSIVPEPSSLSLLLACGAVLMAGRRRKV